MEINSFNKEFDFLSNFFSVEIAFEGILYPTAEHAFQASKTLDIEIRKRISNLQHPGQAKQYGRKVQLRSDWNQVRLQIMEQILRIKFSKEPLRSKLVDTDDAALIEVNYWDDTFWGICKGIGENNLGKLLMKIREDLKGQ